MRLCTGYLPCRLQRSRSLREENHGKSSAQVLTGVTRERAPSNRSTVSNDSGDGGLLSTKSLRSLPNYEYGRRSAVDIEPNGANLAVHDRWI
jgi:hypothetical protein